MRKPYWLACLVVLALTAVGSAATPSPAAAKAGGERRSSLGTISGTVLDSRGNPVAGALVKILRDGLNEVVKETRSNPDGTFATRVTPGRYLVRALAEGFTPATFTSVQVAASTELVYRFNLLPAGEGRTLPERRPDRNDPKFRIRASQSRRSVFNVGEGENEEVADAVERAEQEAAQSTDGEDLETQAPEDEKRSGKGRTQGYVETFVASSSVPGAGTYAGLNFAVKTPVSRDFDMIFAGQAGEFERLEATARLRAGDRHSLSLSLGGARLPTTAAGNSLKKTLALAPGERLGQVSVRAVDEWVVRDGIVLVLGLDYSRFVGAGDASSFSPRLGFAFDMNARTRLHASFGEADGPETRAEGVGFEDSTVVFKEAEGQAVALIDGQAVLERSRRLEFGVERVLGDDGGASVEATAFFDTVSGRGVGLLSTPLEGFSQTGGAALLDIANQQGGARGLRVVYTRRVSQHLRASAGYAFGRGQRLSPEGLSAGPDRLFENAFFQTAAAQLDANVLEGTNVRTVLRFSPGAAVFAIDPFAGRLAVYDPSLSILVTQDLPSFGLPVRAQATVDARNLFDVLSRIEDAEGAATLGVLRRTLRGGISVRF